MTHVPRRGCVAGLTGASAAPALARGRGPRRAAPPQQGAFSGAQLTPVHRHLRHCLEGAGPQWGRVGASCLFPGDLALHWKAGEPGGSASLPPLPPAGGTPRSLGAVVGGAGEEGLGSPVKWKAVAASDLVLIPA